MSDKFFHNFPILLGQLHELLSFVLSTDWNDHDSSFSQLLNQSLGNLISSSSHMDGIKPEAFICCPSLSPIALFDPNLFLQKVRIVFAYVFD